MAAALAFGGNLGVAHLGTQGGGGSLRAVLMVMLGASFPIGTGAIDRFANESQVLRPDGENAWMRLVGRVLFTFFDGQNPVIEALQVKDSDGTLPIELIECFATCFWAIQACRIGAASKNEMRGLAQQLSRLSAGIYMRSGLTYGECNDETVTSILEKMTSTFVLGFSLGEIQSLHRASAARRKPSGEPLSM